MTAPPLNYDDHEAHHAAWAAWPCRFCGGYGAQFVGPGAAQNYAAIYCTAEGCSRHLGWLEWPPRSKTEQKRKRRYRPVRLNEDYCDLCLRPRLQVQAAGQQLQLRHRIDRAALIDAGLPPDDPEHLGWICSDPCHAIEQALRRAFANDLTLIDPDFGKTPVLTVLPPPEPDV